MLSNILMVLSIACFVAILFGSFYFRIKVLKAYKILVANRVQFDSSHLFNMQKLETEILPKYPDQREAILEFVGGIRFSMKCATWLIVTVSAFAAVLMFLKDK